MIKKAILSFIFLCFLLYLNSEKISFSIDYLGLNVATVEMKYESINSQHNITVAAKSSALIDLFTYSLDNTYVVRVDRNLKPIVYNKVIRQKNFQETSITLYDFESQEARYFDSISQNSHVYKILDDTRDFFSALYYLRTLDLRENHIISIDVAGKIVLLEIRFLDTENIRTQIGNVTTNKIEISFKHFDNKRKFNSDMLTNNLWAEENKLYFWFTDDQRQIPVRSHYIVKRMNVYWNIKKYDEK